MFNDIKRLKVLYSFYNFFHKKQLIHNVPLFGKWGLRKEYYSSISSKDFKKLSGTTSGNAEVDQSKLIQGKLFNRLTEVDKQSLISFENKGFAIIKNYLTDRQADEINEEITSLLYKKTVSQNNSHKIMFAIHKSELLKNIGNDTDLKELLSALVNGKVILFQSINFLMGSQQHTHSDSIHMTTFPLGGLVGVWIALEDITEENGPLHYYPGSHKLPYYLNEDYNNEGSRFLLGKKSYKDYEEMIEEKIRSKSLRKINFLAKKGDLIIWHANLFHGGNPHLDKSKTRKSMVFHYFKENSICYHEITQRPALLRL